jgi:hypothetical protein
VEEDQGKRSNVSTTLEQCHGNEWILGQPLLAVDEGKNHHTSNNKKRNHLGRIPWKKYASEIQGQKNHDGAREECEDAKPINGLDPIHKRRMFVSDIKEEQDKQPGKPTYRKIDVNYFHCQPTLHTLSFFSIQTKRKTNTHNTTSTTPNSQTPHPQPALSPPQAPKSPQ